MGQRSTALSYICPSPLVKIVRLYQTLKREKGEDRHLCSAGRAVITFTARDGRRQEAQQRHTEDDESLRLQGEETLSWRTNMRTTAPTVLLSIFQGRYMVGGAEETG